MSDIVSSAASTTLAFAGYVNVHIWIVGSIWCQSLLPVSTGSDNPIILGIIGLLLAESDVNNLGNNKPMTIGPAQWWFCILFGYFVGAEPIVARLACTVGLWWERRLL